MPNALEETSIDTINKIEKIDRLFDRTVKSIEDKIPHLRKEVAGKLFEQHYTSAKRLLVFVTNFCRAL